MVGAALLLWLAYYLITPPSDVATNKYVSSGKFSDLNSQDQHNDGDDDGDDHHHHHPPNHDDHPPNHNNDHTDNPKKNPKKNHHNHKKNHDSHKKNHHKKNHKNHHKKHPTPTPAHHVFETNQELRRVGKVYMDRIRPKMYETLPPLTPSGAPMYNSTYPRMPCWNDDDGQLQCLPGFFILGVFQSGCADLYARMNLHPFLHLPEPYHMLFWAESHPWEEYLDAFSKPGRAVLPDHPGHVIGEMSPATFEFMWAQSVGVLHPEFQDAYATCWKAIPDKTGDGSRPVEEREACFHEARASEAAFLEAHDIPPGPEDTLTAFTTPFHLRSVLGGTEKAKLVVLLRDPVDRLVAAYNTYGQYEAEYGGDKGGFDAYIEVQLGLLEECIASYSRLKCALEFESLEYRFEQLFYHADQITKSMYDAYLPQWKAAFPDPSSILLLRYEEYVADPKPVLQRVFDFLELPPESLSDSDWTTILDAPIKRLSQAGSDPDPPISDAARSRLQAFYAPEYALLDTL